GRRTAPTRPRTDGRPGRTPLCRRRAHEPPLPRRKPRLHPYDLHGDQGVTLAPARGGAPAAETSRSVAEGNSISGPAGSLAPPRDRWMPAALLPPPHRRTSRV